MNIILNNNPEVIEKNQEILTVSELMKIKSFSYKMLIVKVNDALILKENYSTTAIKDGDNVMIIHLMTGG
jgi:sulfur carrier protein